jgi:hypothetical protein
MSHTPGPWTAVQREWGYPREEGGPERRLWEVQGPHGANIAGCTIYSIDGADARLIAAAPELLEALMEAVVWWDDRKPDYEPTGDDPITPWRAAIKKARGL